MVPEFIHNFFKLNLLWIFVISTASNFVLFAGESILVKFSLMSIRQNYGNYIGLVALLSTLYVITSFSIWLYKTILLLIDNGDIKKKKRFLKLLHELNDGERLVVSYFFHKKSRELLLKINKQTLSRLMLYGVISFPYGTERTINYDMVIGRAVLDYTFYNLLTSKGSKYVFPLDDKLNEVFREIGDGNG